MRRGVAALGLCATAAALILQASLTLPASIEAGRGLFLSIVFFFSFFTVLTNIALALIFWAAFDGVRAPGFFRRANTRGFALAAALLVMGIYHFLLAPLWAPEGLWWVADVALHYVTPLLYLGWWLAWGADGTLKPRLALYWLAVPVIYLAYALGRGALLGEYPYHVIDVAVLGYPDVLRNAAVLSALFVVLGLFVVGLDRLVVRLRPASRIRTA